MENNGNQSSRWERIESKVDKLVDTVGDFRADTANRFGAVDSRLASIEATGRATDQAQTRHQAQDNEVVNLKWVRLGVLSGLVVSFSAFGLEVARVLHH